MSDNRSQSQPQSQSQFKPAFHEHKTIPISKTTSALLAVGAVAAIGYLGHRVWTKYQQSSSSTTTTTTTTSSNPTISALPTTSSLPNSTATTTTTTKLQEEDEHSKAWQSLNRHEGDGKHPLEEGFEEDDHSLYKAAAYKPHLPIIAVDLDEVLGQFVTTLCVYHNEKYGTSLKLSDFFSYNFSLVWGGTAEEATKKVMDFFKSEHFQRIPPVAGAQEALYSLKQHFNFVVVTSRQHFIAANTRRWLQIHYPDLFCAIMFGNHFSFSGKRVTKKELCELAGASGIIDDNISYVKECAQINDFKAVLFDWNFGYGWSASKDNDASLPANVKRFSEWKQVQHFMLENVDNFNKFHQSNPQRELTKQLEKEI